MPDLLLKRLSLRTELHIVVRNDSNATDVQRFWWKATAWTAAVFSIVCVGLLLHRRDMSERIRQLILKIDRLQNQDPSHKRRQVQH